jgi:hypothetical protein
VPGTKPLRDSISGLRSDTVMQSKLHAKGWIEATFTGELHPLYVLSIPWCL